MKIWLLAMIVTMSVEPGTDGLVSPQNGQILKIVTEREEMQKMRRVGKLNSHITAAPGLYKAVYTDAETCHRIAESWIELRQPKGISVNATCVEFDIER